MVAAWSAPSEIVAKLGPDCGVTRRWVETVAFPSERSVRVSAMIEAIRAAEPMLDPRWRGQARRATWQAAIDAGKLSVAAELLRDGDASSRGPAAVAPAGPVVTQINLGSGYSEERARWLERFDSMLPGDSPVEAPGRLLPAEGGQSTPEGTKGDMEAPGGVPGASDGPQAGEGAVPEPEGVEIDPEPAGLAGPGADVLEADDDE